jgi:hypothetical protein
MHSGMRPTPKLLRQVDGDGRMRPFLYTPGRGFQDLRLPTDPQGSSLLNAMNDRGRTVGELSDEGGVNVPYRPFHLAGRSEAPQHVARSM